MRKKTTILILFSLFIFIFFVFYKSLNKSNIYEPSTILNKKILNISTLELLSKDQIDLNTILNKENFTILNIWSSWCLPCRNEHKYLVELSREENMSLVGLNYKDTNKNAIEFLKKYGNPFSSILIDKDGTKSIELGAYGVPETYIIDNNRNIIKKIIGPIDENEFKEIKKIIK